MTFEKLMMDAISIKRNGIDVWEGYREGAKAYHNGTKHIEVQDFLKRKYHKKYAINNSVVAFVYREEMFVIPLWKDVIDTLDKHGFSKADFFVPFSNGEVPRWKMGQWHELRKEAERNNQVSLEQAKNATS